MNTIGWMIPAFVCGYVAAAFTWDKLHTWIIGESAKAAALRQKVRDLEASARAKLGIGK